MTPKRAVDNRARLHDIREMDVANDDGNPFMSEASLDAAGTASTSADPLLLIVPEPPPAPLSSTMQRRLSALASLAPATHMKRLRLPPQAVIQATSLVGAGVMVGVAITLFTVSSRNSAPAQTPRVNRATSAPVLTASSYIRRNYVPYAQAPSPGDGSAGVLANEVATPHVNPPPVAAPPPAAATPLPAATPTAAATPAAATVSPKAVAPPPRVAEEPRRVAAIPVEVRPTGPLSESMATVSEIKPAVSTSKALAGVSPALPDPTPLRTTMPTLGAATPTLPAATPRVSDVKPALADPTPAVAVAKPVSDAAVTAAPSAAAVSSAAATSASDRQAVDGLLNVYKESYTRLDASMLEAVWRGVDANKVARSFASLATQELKFYRCKVSMEDARATASCLGRLVFVPRVGAPYPRERALTWAFEFSQTAGRWLIDQVKIQ